MALTNEQLILLDNLIYLDDTVASYDTDSVTVSVVVNSLLEKSKNDFKKAVEDEQFYYCDDMVNGMTADEWRTVLNAIAADETLMNMKITNISDDNYYKEKNNKSATGFRAACFTNGEDTAVVYRGTVGSYQWDDNGVGGTAAGTISQWQAYDYLRLLQNKDDIKNSSIYVSGHSKGGNMAQFAALIADNTTDLNIEMCLSFNGQGFSKQFLDYAAERGFLNDESINKMHKIASENDVVNSLFGSIENDNVKENITYIKSSGTVSTILDYGLVGHIGSDVLTSDGKLNNVAAPKPMHAFMSELMSYMNENVDTETYESICNGLMGLLADNDNMGELFINFILSEKAYNPSSTFTIYNINEYQRSTCQLLAVLDDFCSDSKNRGLLGLAAMDCIYSDGILTAPELEILFLLVEKYHITSDDIENAKTFYDLYVNEFINETIIFDDENKSVYLDATLKVSVNLIETAIKNAIERGIELIELYSKIADDVLPTRKEIINNEFSKKITSETHKKFYTARTTKYDPLILDLDGDGYNVETKELGANFDLDKNGFAEKINWTSRDGFLCLDLNGNGTIDDGGELFGDQTLLADGTTAKNGFEALAQYDSNGDGVIDAGDEIFDSLRIWVDADGNGITGEGEMKTLAELGIVSINLGYENVNDETGTEATIGNSATFTREDGTTGGVAELWVSSDLFDTVDNMSVEIPDDIKELPNVCSIGNVYSLLCCSI